MDVGAVDDKPTDHVAIADRLSQFLFRIEAARLVRIRGGHTEGLLELGGIGSHHTHRQIVRAALQRRQDEDHQQQDQDHAETAAHGEQHDGGVPCASRGAPVGHRGISVDLRHCHVLLPVQ
ncbi:hypothetical protein [Rhodococcus zopfii]|uniref:hypothetical protein n=1 Tax=Rhodococcus zopfii TaxID=43772 RepID=UPI0014860514|nr:hypothetical protein [Rhodococcus zopfii]